MKFGFTLWEECNISEFKSRVLRIFGPKRGEVLGVERTI